MAPYSSRLKTASTGLTCAPAPCHGSPTPHTTPWPTTPTVCCWPRRTVSFPIATASSRFFSKSAVHKRSLRGFIRVRTDGSASARSIRGSTRSGPTGRPDRLSRVAAASHRSTKTAGRISGSPHGKTGCTG